MEDLPYNEKIVLFKNNVIDNATVHPQEAEKFCHTLLTEQARTTYTKNNEELTLVTETLDALARHDNPAVTDLLKNTKSRFKDYYNAA